MALSLADKRGKPGIRGGNVSVQAGIEPYKIDSLYRFAATDFKGYCIGHRSTGAAISETDTHINYFQLGSGLVVEKLNIGTQVASKGVPVQGTAGLDLAGVAQTNNLGAAYSFGGANDRGQLVFTVGTDEFYARLKIKIEDVSGADVCAFGFRKVAAGNATFSSYTDKACLNVNGGAIYSVTNLNSGGDTSTSLSLSVADAGSVTLEVQVDLGGNVKYLVDGAVPSAAPAFVLDATDNVIPFFDFLNDVDVVGYIEASEFKCGLKASNARQPTE